MKSIMLVGFDGTLDLKSIVDDLRKTGTDVPVLILSKDKSKSEIQLGSSQLYFESDLYDINSKALTDLTIRFEDLVFLRDKYSFLLRSMSRWDKGLANNDDRLFLIDRLFTFFVQLLRGHKINLVLHSTGTPHHFYDLILSLAAEFLKVKNVFQLANQLSNRVRFVEGLEYRTVAVEGIGQDSGTMERYLKSLTEHKEISAVWRTEALSDKTKTTLLAFLAQKFPRYLGRAIKNALKPHNSINIYSNECSGLRVFKVAFSLIGSVANIVRTRKLYHGLRVSEVEPDSFVIYGHFQPEGTSHPDGGLFPDMRYWSNYLKSKYPRIYYKEHVASFLFHDGFEMTNSQSHRSADYYTDIHNMGVTFLNERFPTRELFNKNAKIFTLSGTVILEGAINGVEILYPGYPWFGLLPKTETVLDESGIKLKSTKRASYEELMKHFEAQDRYSFPNIGGWNTAMKDSSMNLAQYSLQIQKLVQVISNTNDYLID